MKPNVRYSHFLAAAIVLSSAQFSTANTPTAQPLSMFLRESNVIAEPFVRAQIDPHAVAAAISQPQITITRLPMPDGSQVDLELTKTDPFSPNAKIISMTASGPVSLGRPAMANFHGTVAGHPASFVFLSTGAHGIGGWVELNGKTYFISSDPNQRLQKAVIFCPTDLPPGVLNIAPFTCGSDQLAPLHRIRPQHLGAAQPRGAAFISECRSADIAVETDYEYLADLFGGDTGAATSYVGALLGAVSEIYIRDFNARLEISYLRLWESSNDPWDQGNTLDQLFQFQNYWNANMTGEVRSVAHYLSGRALGGGVAYVDALCYPDYDYGLSANLGGYFPYPTEHNNAANWDLMVTAHELGHNFGAPHTHDMTPPIDNCAGGDCSVTPNGTIMSYCHLCPGGLANVRMEMHTRTVYEAILPAFVNQAFCELGIPCDPVGDCNGDGQTNLADVDCFVAVALGTNPYNGPLQRCDLVNDGTVNGLDLPLFVNAVLP